MKKVLFISGGYGEDAVGANLLNQLLIELEKRGLKTSFYVFPAWGLGKAYDDLANRYSNVEIVVRNQALKYESRYMTRDHRFLPDLVYRGWGSCYNLLHGGWRNCWKQTRALLQLRRQIDLIIGISDTTPAAIINLLYFRKDLFLIAGGHTVLTEPRFSLLEKWLLRKYVKLIYARDLPTAEFFKKMGATAKFLGFWGSSVRLTGFFPSQLENTPRRVILLPGSRGDWPENLSYLLETISEVERKSSATVEHSVAWVISLSSNINVKAIEALSKKGVFEIRWMQTNKNKYVIGELQYRGMKILLVRGEIYGDLLQKANLVVGFAGAAMEQAVALGVPVIGPWRRQAAQNKRFIFERQAKLLGDGFILGYDRPEKTAEVLSKALENLDEYKTKAHEYALSTWGALSAAECISRELIEFLR